MIKTVKKIVEMGITVKATRRIHVMENDKVDVFPFATFEELKKGVRENCKLITDSEGDEWFDMWDLVDTGEEFEMTVSFNDEK